MKANIQTHAIDQSYTSVRRCFYIKCDSIRRQNKNKKDQNVKRGRKVEIGKKYVSN